VEIGFPACPIMSGDGASWHVHRFAMKATRAAISDFGSRNTVGKIPGGNPIQAAGRRTLLDQFNFCQLERTANDMRVINFSIVQTTPGHMTGLRALAMSRGE